MIETAVQEELEIREIEQKALAWLSAFNTKDIEALLALYDDQAEHCSLSLRARQPETGGFIVGKHKLRAWWTDAFSRLPSLRYRLVRLTISESRVFIEYDREVENEPTTRIAELLEFKGNTIRKSRVFQG